MNKEEFYQKYKKCEPIYIIGSCFWEEYNRFVFFVKEIILAEKIKYVYNFEDDYFEFVANNGKFYKVKYDDLLFDYEKAKELCEESNKRSEYEQRNGKIC